jgi:hypothetical protein
VSGYSFVLAWPYELALWVVCCSELWTQERKVEGSSAVAPLTHCNGRKQFSLETVQKSPSCDVQTAATGQYGTYSARGTVHVLQWTKAVQSCMHMTLSRLAGYGSTWHNQSGRRRFGGNVTHTP